MIKYQLESLDALDDSVKSLYTEKDGKFVLAIEGLPQPEDVSGLKSKLEELLSEKKTEAEKRRQAEEAAKLAAEEAARKTGDIGALENSWREKMAAREQELLNQLKAKDSAIIDMTSGQTAVKLAAELAVQGSADVLLPHIKSRLRTEYRNDQPVTVVLDREGRPSAMTIDDLKKEFVGNAAFAPLIVASKASGAGRTVGESGGAIKPGSLTGSKSDRLAAIEQMIANSK
jgi:riboflavin biosynthesis pyrimidine reductase